MRAIHNPITAFLRVTAVLMWSVLFLPLYALILLVPAPAFHRRLARLYWLINGRLIGLHIKVHGTPSSSIPTLYVANHVSYFDIVVLGSLVRAAFVAKNEVRSWPGIGLVARLGGTVFVDRKRQKSAQQRDAIRQRLAENTESLILFPEGTSSDGTRVLPFKSALFSVADVRSVDGRPLVIQPISLSYTRLDGMPLGRLWRPYFLWYGDMELASHLWMAAGLGHVTVEVEFHPTVKIDMFATRKSLAEHCHSVVRDGVTAANAGRPRTPLPASPVNRI